MFWICWLWFPFFAKDRDSVMTDKQHNKLKYSVELKSRIERSNQFELTVSATREVSPRYSFDPVFLLILVLFESSCSSSSIRAAPFFRFMGAAFFFFAPSPSAAA